MMTLDQRNTKRQTNPVLFNSGTEIGVSNTLADSRRIAAIFTSVYNTIGALSSMAGHGGRVLALAGSNVPVRQSCHAPATPDWRRDGGLDSTLEVTMPKIFRALSRLFPCYTVPAAIEPTKADARSLAAMLVSQGRRVVITPTVSGYSVQEVR